MTNIAKKSIAHNGDIGSLDTTSGYIMKANPAPIREIEIYTMYTMMLSFMHNSTNTQDSRKYCLIYFIESIEEIHLLYYIHKDVFNYTIVCN